MTLIQRKRRTLTWEYLAVGVLVLLVIFSIASAKNSKVERQNMNILSIHGTEITIELATTGKERTKGLSGRSGLKEGTGMLFVFDHSERYTFWMPDMHFAIDIIWIGEDKKIVDIAPRVTPESYPSVFSPSRSALYVLEVNAGDAERYGWTVGDEVTIPSITK